ncbi:MAG TPA: 6-carboxytetrahydropterin synthase [Bacteriovoracaceae bacterium]|nr:6-carboxytetrahydropterin synthase [Bacteriovoracaceae bacterium]
MSLPFSIKVYKQYFNFASSHFMIFENGSREPLHGHNYRVQVKGEAPDLSGDMVFDFLDIKPIVREVCDSLDHKLLIPKECKLLKIYTEKKNYVIETPDESVFSIPQTDVLLLPILNTSAERLAVYICGEIRNKVMQKFGFHFNSIEVEVEETPGQSAVFLHREKL